MLKATTLIAACLVGTVANAQSGKIAGKMPVDDSFLEWGITWSSGVKYEALVALTNIKGKVALCGVGHLNNHSLKNINREALRDYRLLINKRVVLEDFSFFASATSFKSLPRSKAKCKFTSLTQDQIGPKPIIDVESTKSRYRE